MPRRTTRPTPRKKSSSNAPTRHYSQNTNTPSANKPATTNIPQTSMMGNVAQGMSLGAGAALGSSIFNGAFGSMSSQSDSNKESKFDHLQQVQEDEIRCGHLMRQFKDCSTSYNDLNNCRPLLDYYISCLSQNTKL